MTVYFIILSLALIATELLYIAIVRRYVPSLQKQSHPIGRTYVVNGGGIIFFPAMAAAMAIPGIGVAYGMLVISAFALWIVSLADDARNLSVSSRLVVHLLASAVAVYYSIGIGALPYVLAVIMLTGLTNIYNFLDGIRGMLALYSIVVLISLAITLSVLPELEPIRVYIPAIESMLIAAVVFSIFNVILTERIFSGDVGAIVMGFFIGWMLIAMIFTGRDYTLFALIIVYVVDAVITLLMRLIRRENIFRSHNCHLYQRLARKGLSHRSIAGGYAVLQLVISAGYILSYDFVAREVWFLASTAICIILFALLYARTKSTAA